MAKPAWWNDEDLKALSKWVVRTAANEVTGHIMRADVLRGIDAWQAGPRSAAEFEEAAKHYERAVELEHAPALGRVQRALACLQANARTPNPCVLPCGKPS